MADRPTSAALDRPTVEPLAREIDAGLDKVHALTPGTGYLDAMLGASSDAGAFARAELGYHATEALDLFGFGKVETGRFDQLVPRWEAGAGLRLKF